MASTRTTITMDKKILEDAQKKAKENNEPLSAFLDRAAVNQLEREGVFGTRYDLRKGEELNG